MPPRDVQISIHAGKDNSSYSPLNTAPFDDELDALRAKIEELKEKEHELDLVLDRMEKKHIERAEPFVADRRETVLEKEKAIAELEKRTLPPTYPPALGPSDMQFVDSGWFSALCNAVVVLNLLSMALAGRLQAYRSTLYVFDQLFLLWYVFELSAKLLYHRNDLFFGSISVVWWNWLDALIVISGILDQWLMVLVKNFIPIPIPSASSWLRWLRLFRILRFMKVLKSFVQGDLAWTEEAPFQLFMSGVIAVNSVVMALELDYEWAGWPWFEQIFLVIYTFELAVRLKGFGCHFFVNNDLVWNNLDFAMVLGGAFSLWLLPAYSMFTSTFYGTSQKTPALFSNFTKILRIAKIIRVLRLVRLLRMIKPLYHLLVGVISAFEAMKWVLVLTLLVLYAGAIVFTSLIGHGYIYSDLSDVPPEAELYFGSVPQSIFSLFKVMNGDTDIVAPICKDIKGRLLFASFMILSNWAVLAILTSVVSDHMIMSSQKLVEEEVKKDEEEVFISRSIRLKHFFNDIDLDQDGRITKTEWDEMLNNDNHFDYLNDLTGLDRKTLHEMFFVLSEEKIGADLSPKHGNDLKQPWEFEEAFLRFDDFIEHLNHDKDAADRSQILHLRYWLEKVTLRKLEQIDNTLQANFAAMERAMGLPGYIEGDRRCSIPELSTHPSGIEFPPTQFNLPESVQGAVAVSARSSPFSNGQQSQRWNGRSLALPTQQEQSQDRNGGLPGFPSRPMEDIAFLSRSSFDRKGPPGFGFTGFPGHLNDSFQAAQQSYNI